MSTIQLTDVQKHFQRRPIIQNVSLSIDSGKIFGLIGPSGCGKTTLIKLMVGMLKADAGHIEVLQQAVPNYNLLQKIGYMAQSDALYTDLTGIENMQFFAKLYSFNKVERAKRITYAADIVQLTNALSQKVETYSGGMKRRLSLAIALIQNPDILILDEPTVGIDPALKLTIWQELERLKKVEKKTILITTHVMDEAEKCDELALMREGKIITHGTPTELKTLYNAKTFDEVFLQAGGAKL
ncbi:ABC transporter ATP-binding protein [Viridibacillus sp. YIM B01967]|uniref:ABC transporter ATP-binding protein n=1 Tax=Viridibacillus soli TaxID=2798301 RepID=A0ABS1H699_9BACL|nr:ABC transporter ATP-binding protein [Viridibacillus soli]MBK3494935.1 ABC transporter ATP-binding protein [Viridibacillus soli]